MSKVLYPVTDTFTKKDGLLYPSTKKFVKKEGMLYPITHIFVVKEGKYRGVSEKLFRFINVTSGTNTLGVGDDYVFIYDTWNSASGIGLIDVKNLEKRTLPRLTTINDSALLYNHSENNRGIIINIPRTNDNPREITEFHLLQGMTETKPIPIPSGNTYRMFVSDAGRTFKGDNIVAYCCNHSFYMVDDAPVLVYNIRDGSYFYGDKQYGNGNPIIYGMDKNNILHLLNRFDESKQIIALNNQGQILSRIMTPSALSVFRDNTVGNPSNYGTYFTTDTGMLFYDFNARALHPAPFSDPYGYLSDLSVGYSDTVIILPYYMVVMKPNYSANDSGEPVTDLIIYNRISGEVTKDTLPIWFGSCCYAGYTDIYLIPYRLNTATQIGSKGIHTSAISHYDIITKKLTTSRYISGIPSGIDVDKFWRLPNGEFRMILSTDNSGPGRKSMYALVECTERERVLELEVEHVSGFNFDLDFKPTYIYPVEYPALTPYTYLPVKIDWGDGYHADYVDSQIIRHAYNSAGKYKISITGNLHSLSIVLASRPYVTRVLKLGAIGSINFINCTSLRSVAITDTTHLITSFSTMFAGCTALEYAPEIWKLPIFKTSGTIGCFYGCNNTSNYDEIPEGWK